MQKLETELLKLLKKLEWSSNRQGPPSAMGRNDGELFESCPDCGGVKPSELAKMNFTRVGHERSCALHRYLTMSKHKE